MQDLAQSRLFDYSSLDTDTRIVVQQRTSEIKGLMKRAAEDIIQIGQRLIEVKACLSHNTWETWLLAEFDWSDQTARRFIHVARSFGSEKQQIVAFAPSALYLLAAPSTPEEARIEAIDRAEAGEEITYTAAKQIVNEYKPGRELLAEAGAKMDKPPAAIFDDLPFVPREGELANDEPEDDVPVGFEPIEYNGDVWYTPAEYIDAARVVLGHIDLDPASCDEAQAVVKASRHYTIDDDGLALPWYGRVWLNPPYSMPLIQKFVKRLIEAHQAGDITAAIILTNNCTDAGWFHSLMESYPVCFTRGRIAFWRPDRSTFATRQGQAFFYLGCDVERFYQVFAEIGCFPNLMGGNV
jgi:phage N-6-adenine-methyltransferase